MGPHVFACGNMTPSPSFGARMQSFNGAARFCVRKYINWASYYGTQVTASMGPHVFACGNLKIFPGISVYLNASMGPHVFACGNLEPEGGGGGLDHERFNGAARFCVRKYILTDPINLLPFASMGPHVFACGNLLP